MGLAASFCTLKDITQKLVIFEMMPEGKQKVPTLQIFIVILLCKSIKDMGKMCKLMIGKILCKNYLWIPGIVKQLWKPSKNKSQCGLGLLSVSNRFWYEGKMEEIGNNL